MKIKRVLLISVVVLLLFSACENIPQTNAGGPIESEYAASNLERETNPSVEQNQIDDLVKGNTDFALTFYDQIRGDHDNIIFSPISLSLALSMTLTGAETSTESEMMDALQFPLKESEVHPAFNALLLAIEESEGSIPEEAEGNGFQLNIANSIWGQAGFDFKAEFLDILALQYGAGVYHVDFSAAPEEARNAINGWIADETEEKITDLIPPSGISPMTRMVLANAIYFNASWKDPFNKSNTEKAPFYFLDGTEATVDMMKLFGQSLAYGQGDGYQVVSLPYLSTDFSMLLLVPDAGEFSSVEDRLMGGIDDGLRLESLLEEMRYEQVTLHMPKFDFETMISANDPLGALGMSEAFDPEKADFSGMTEAEKLFISSVLHKATITVDEEGTEAAAATVVIMTATSAEPSEPINLVIDRPFIFAIHHRPTGSILFLGRVLQP
jgi:serpin B